MCVSCPGYIASHPTDNVHAMQGVRPFCGLISHFFPQKYPAVREYISEIDHVTQSFEQCQALQFQFQSLFFGNVSQGFCTFTQKEKWNKRIGIKQYINKLLPVNCLFIDVQPLDPGADWGMQIESVKVKCHVSKALLVEVSFDVMLATFPILPVAELSIGFGIRGCQQ